MEEKEGKKRRKRIIFYQNEHSICGKYYSFQLSIQHEEGELSSEREKREERIKQKREKESMRECAKLTSGELSVLANSNMSSSEDVVSSSPLSSDNFNKATVGLVVMSRSRALRYE